MLDYQHTKAQNFRKQLLRRPIFTGYMLAKLPLAAAAGLKVVHLDQERCSVTIPYRWSTTNPFGSIYFAALCMAAEMSTAGLALMAGRGGSVDISVLPVRVEGRFEKKATGLTTFTCTDGPKLWAAAEKADTTGEAVIETATTVGTLENGTVVAHFTLDWSFKKKA